MTFVHNRCEPAETPRVAQAFGARALKWLIYPGVMATGVAVMAATIQAGVPLAIAPYGAVVLAGVLILMGERAIPYRPGWQPSAHDLFEDGLFVLVVQLAVPLALGWLTLWLVQDQLSASGITLHLWPAHWPLWVQVLAKIAIGDFFRYWLHRWSHERPILWRVHAIHHHPPKLYATNVFRFHPLDKALQFVGDSLPFILLGVGPEVLAYYFVIYATSGLFQHSNVDLRLGWLNYLIMGPEAHRWHHSQVIAESDANYAHTFALWDVLFGTYRRPRGMEVERLGLLDEDYPTDFIGQMTAPITRTGSAPATGCTSEERHVLPR